ncbi:hypothetical protein [Gilvimarinus algae]|uniref:Transmembrane protein n=1 Tax=Gilvimarinus algae TaxID=3058037 RepID=A0ABT8TF53_9GAMM|nr:hypothetical protein [Gilvimarinus sp. SDUM040014]MDO3382727.1 hypothetical protein [Gilvimarinus sp. SDUM040014]
MNNKIHSALVGLIKYVICPLGTVMWLAFIVLHWAEPSIAGFDRTVYVAQGAVQVWAVRLLYIYFLLFAMYRSYAELGDRFDLPYELWPAMLAFLVPLLLVMAMVQFQWFS